MLRTVAATERLNIQRACLQLELTFGTSTIQAERNDPAQSTACSIHVACMADGASKTENLSLVHDLFLAPDRRTGGCDQPAANVCESGSSMLSR